jgi:probable phosphoglycerate mutase
MFRERDNLLILVRHGETDFNASRLVQMPSAPLSDQGRNQAVLLANRLAESGITHIVSSDFPRAVDTAAAVSRRTGISVDLNPLLRERDFGDLVGLPYDDAFPCRPLPPDFVPPNGESTVAFQERVAEAWAFMTALVSGTRGNLLVVTHGLVCKALVSAYVEPVSVGIVPRTWFNTSVTEIEATPPWVARRVNCVAHLPSQDRTR